MRKTKYLLTSALFACLLFTGCQPTKPTDVSSVEKKETQDEDGDVASEYLQTEETELIIETEPDPEPIITTLTLTATGDCTLGVTQQHGYSGSFHAYYDSYGKEYFFENFKEVFGQDDLTLINLECVLTDSNNRVEKAFNLKGKPEYVDIMTVSSIEACSLGNNHTRDYGEESLIDTKEVLDNAGIVYAYNDIVSYYTSDEGIVVGIVSASLLSQSEKYENYMLEGVKKARKEGADIVVACCHWGIEREYYPNSYQKNMAHQLIDAGADLIIGNHPHVLQGVEEYKGKIICYSLGNFCFGGNRNPAEKNTIVYQQTFTFMDGILQPDITAEIIPSRISGHSDYNDFQPMIAEGTQALNIINKMNEYSKPYSGVSFQEDGTLVINTNTD
ncbi:MAG: CapA family protein [Lachnospiraceae bacterium]|nr:CapA family protein [Lachnospiraceae bacterium]